MTVFGRDTIITCLQTLLFGPELARTALEVLAELQANEDDPSIDAEPGKIVHEVRHGKAARDWFERYYGTVDATPLYLILLSEVWRWTDDAALVQRAAASRRCARSSGSTSTATATATASSSTSAAPSTGSTNQSWKDSWDSQRFHDGTLAQPPIAPCEVQGYVYDAKRRMAEIAREVWRDRALADRLEREAAELRERFDEAFWVEERGGYYALALDGEKRQVDSLCSNIGHLLWSGIVPPERVDAIVDQLMGDDALVGLGRAHDVDRRRRLQPALATTTARSGPTTIRSIAAGLARYARWPEAQRIVQRMLDGGAALRLPAARGLRGHAPRGDAVPDRLPDRRAPAGVGRGDAGAAPAAAARAAARPASGTRSRPSRRSSCRPGRARLRLSGVRAFGRRWDVRVENGRVRVEEA